MPPSPSHPTDSDKNTTRRRKKKTSSSSLPKISPIKACFGAPVAIGNVYSPKREEREPEQVYSPATTPTTEQAEKPDLANLASSLKIDSPVKAVEDWFRSQASSTYGSWWELGWGVVIILFVVFPAVVGRMPLIPALLYRATDEFA